MSNESLVLVDRRSDGVYLLHKMLVRLAMTQVTS
jgi:hypothetical protein